MTSELPLPPTSNITGKLIGAAIAMLLVAGGLVAWKISRNHGDTAPATSVAATATTAETRSDNAAPPPPPPPPAEPETTATSEASATANKSVKSGTGSACGGDCTGTETAELKRFFAGRAAQGRKCYEKALMQNSTLAGKMRVQVRVQTSGQPCSVSITADELHDPTLSACIVGMFRASTYPAPTGGCVVLEAPLSFSPQK